MATQSVNVNFRMDYDLKKDLEQVCSEMGLTMTSAFTMFAKKVIRERKIPFEISGDPFYGQDNIGRLKNSIRQLQKGDGTMHELIEE